MVIWDDFFTTLNEIGLCQKCVKATHASRLITSSDFGHPVIVQRATLVPVSTMCEHLETILVIRIECAIYQDKDS